MKRGGTWESHIQDLIRKYSVAGSIVLDIGAHIGTHTLVMSQAVGTEGHVLAFEPQPKTFRELFLNMAINDLKNISFYWAGVGDRAGNIELGPMHESNEGGTGLGGGTGQTVQLLTVDSLGLSNVSLMKIDVEGMEDQVLLGARETILANRPVIIIEIMGGHDIGDPSKETRQKILHTIDMLEEMGYKVQQLWRHDWIAFPS
jgi:FkbM family methyltransferase